MIFCGEILYNRSMGAAQDLENIDLLLRSGAVSTAQKRLKKLSLKNYSIHERIRAASLAKRALLPHYGIKWLFSSVYPDGRINRECPSAALLEYSANLISAGAVLEGRRLLKWVLERNESQAHLYLAFSYMREWDYENSSQHLEQYLSAYRGDAYGKIVAQVNLLASRVRTRPNDQDTIELSKEILHTAQGKDYRRLFLNALELSVQLSISRSEYIEARKHIAQLAEASPNEASLEYLFWMKWKLILDFLESNKKELAPLKSLLDLATRFQHGETLRDAHLRWALARKDQLLFEHVYQGTPHFSFKAQAEKDFLVTFGHDYQPSQRHNFLANKTGFTPIDQDLDSLAALNLLSGYAKKSSATWEPEFKTQQLPFQLLQVICSDFYQNKNNVELSAHIYSGSFFHPLHSIQGIQQLIKRLNDRFLELETDCKVHFRNNRYELRSNALVFCKGVASSAPLLKEEWKLLEYFSQENQKKYSRKELEQLTQTPSRTLSRYLEKLVSEKEVLSVGRGPNTRYLRNPDKL